MINNVLFIDNKEEFQKGIFSNVELLCNNDNNVIMLNKKKLEGSFITSEYETGEFKRLVLSWNCVTPENSSIEVEARVYINGIQKEWSPWLSWGIWGANIKRASSNTNSEVAKVSTDELYVKGGEEIKANKIQLRVKLNSSDGGLTPKLYSIVASYHGVDKNNKIDANEYQNQERYVLIETPKISQYLREPSIANRICSPTSITMLLNRMQEELIVEDVAWNVYDYNYEGFGNWAFNTAFAGSIGYKAYLEYGNLNSIKRELLKGYPIAASVKYTNEKQNLQLPFIENAPTTTNGHLIVVTGIEKDYKGEEYIIVNDPAGKSNEEVMLKYKLESFLIAWETSNNIMYVINKK